MTLKYNFSLQSIIYYLVMTVFCAENAIPQEQNHKGTKIEEQDGIGLRLEELLSEKGTLRVELSTLLNSYRQAGISSTYDTIQTGLGQYISIPINTEQTLRSVDTIIGNIGVRYGLTAKSELYARSSLRYSSSRLSNRSAELTENLSDSSFQNLVVGMNYRFLDEGKTPGFIGFFDVTAIENNATRGSDLSYGKSGTIGFTAYRVYDPVVLSITAGYRANLERSTGRGRIDPGDVFFINPSIAFAVNNEITLTGGFGLLFSGADKLNNTRRNSRTTVADLQFGVAYAWDKNTILRADIRTDVLGERNFTAGINLTRKFWGL